MPTIPAGDLTTLRTTQHETQVYVTILKPITLWSARINDVGIGFGDTVIAFDTGTGFSFDAIQPVQEVWVGTQAGEDDVGRFRVRDVTSGDGGVTGTLTIAAHSKPLTDDLHLTFRHDYPLKPRFSLVEIPDPDVPEIIDTFKDVNIDYTDQNEFPGPVLIAGGHQARFLPDGQTWVIPSILPNSYPMTAGATITNYSASIYPDTFGHTININPTTGVGDITLTTPAQYWVKYSITDSNGQTQDSFRFYYAHSTDPTSEHYPQTKFRVEDITGSWDNGWAARLSTAEQVPKSEIPDRALCIVWQETKFNGVEQIITPFPQQSKTILSGYFTEEQVSEDESTDIGDVGFTVKTIDNLMRNIPTFSISLAARPDPSDWYEYDTNLDLGQAAYHVWKWHSTLLEICDVFNLDVHSVPRAFTEFEKGNLYTVVDDMVSQAGDRSHVLCAKDGSIRIPYDTQLLPDTLREAQTVTAEIEDSDLTGSVTITHRHENKVSRITTQGFYFDGTFYTPCEDDLCCDSPPCECNDPPCPNVIPYCAQAPGDWPDDSGGGTADFPRQVFESQDQANKIAGRFFAKENNPYPEFRVAFHSNYLTHLEPAFSGPWTVSLTAQDSNRQIIWTNKRLYVRSVTARYDHEAGHITCEAVFEPDAEGFEGVPYDCPTLPSPDWDFDLDIDFGEWDLDQGVWTGSSVHFTPVGEYDWQLLTGDNVNDLSVDRFSSGFTNGTTVLWRCGLGKIYRSNDGGQTWSDVTPTGPIDGVGVGSIDFVEVDAVSGGSACIGRYHNGSNWQSWLFFTDDNGQIWTYVTLSDGSGPLDCSSEDLRTWDTIDTGVGGSSSPYLNGTLRQNVARLEDSKFAIAYRDDTDLKVKIINMSSGSLVEGTPATIPENPSTYLESILPVVIALDASTVIVQQRDFAIAGTVSGNTITLASSTIDTWSEYPTGTSRRAVTATPLSSSSYITIAKIVADAGEPIPYKLHFRECTVSGTTITPQTDYAITDFVTATSTQTTFGLPSILGGGIWVAGIANSYYSGGSQVEAAHVAVGDTDSVDIQLIPVTLSGRTSLHVKVDRLDSSSAIALYDEADEPFDNHAFYLRVINVNTVGATISSMGTPLEFAADTYNETFTSGIQFPSSVSDVAIAAVSDTEIIVTVPYTEFFEGSTQDCDRIFYFERSGDTLTEVGYCDVMWTTGADIHLYSKTDAVLALSGFSIDELALQDLTGCMGGGDAVKALGLSNTGTGVLVTEWNSGNNELQVLEYVIPGLSFAGSASLGSCTEGELDAGTYVAYPHVGWGGRLYVFGRMNNPQSLGGPAHVINYFGGVWGATETSWGNDVCGSLVVRSDGTVLAVRNGADYGRLHSGSSSELTYLCNLPFGNGVAPRGLAIGFLTGDLFAASEDPNTQMVCIVPSPYTQPADITVDHPTGSGVNAIVAR